MDKVRGQHQQISNLLEAVQVIPKFNPFQGFDGDGREIPAQEELAGYIAQSQSIQADIEQFDDKELKEIAKSTSNKKLSKEDTDYLEVVLEAITVFESTIQLHDKSQLNLRLSQLRVDWNVQHTRCSDLIRTFAFHQPEGHLNNAIDILNSSSSAVDEMIEIVKVPDTFLDEQDKLENSLTQLISLIQTYNTLIHHLYLDSWLYVHQYPHQFDDLMALKQVIQSADTFQALHQEVYNQMELLDSVRKQTSAMIHINDEYNRLAAEVPAHDALAYFRSLVQDVIIIPDQSSQLLAQINTKVHNDVNDFLSQLNSKYGSYFSVVGIRDRAKSILDDSNIIAPLPAQDDHARLVEALNQVNCETPSSKHVAEECKGLLGQVVLLCQAGKQIDDADKVFSQLLNAIDEQKDTDGLHKAFQDNMANIPCIHDKRVSRHVNRLKTAFDEVIDMALDDDSLSTSQRSYRHRSSSIESSSSALSSLSLVDYKNPRARASSSSSSTHKKLFDVTHDEDVPPVPPLPNMKDWSRSPLNLPGPTPKSARKQKPRMLQPPGDSTPSHKHGLTKATLSSISRRANRVVSTPTPSKSPSDVGTSQKRVLSTSSSASSLKPPAMIDGTPTKSKSVAKKKSSSSFHSARSPRRSFKVPYRANPRSKLDLAVGKVVNSLPLSVNIERAVVAPTDSKKSYDSGKYWIGAPEPKLCFCRILRSNTVMVRVGGGWEELSKYLLTHYANLFAVDTVNSTPDVFLTPAKNRNAQNVYSPSSEHSPTPSPFMSPYRA